MQLRATFLQAYGSDSDKALVNALEEHFPEACQFLCDMHMRDNVKEQCRKLHVDEMLTREIMGDVFGERSGELKLRKRHILNWARSMVIIQYIKFLSWTGRLDVG